MNARRAGRGGFTLVEVMVTLVITGIVVAGLFRMFNAIHKWSITSGVKAEQQQNARIGLETFTRDLEMAGYHTTNYGDAGKGGLAITYAAANAIEMDQHRMNIVDNDLAHATYEPRLVYYHLATDAATGRQNLYRQIRTEPGLANPDELVAEGVSDFTLGYFTKDDTAVGVSPPLQYTAGVAPPAALKTIKRVTVTLTTSAAGAAVPVGTINPTYTLTASVMPQNLENPETAGDAIAPAVPTGLNVVDSRSCTTKLRARWNKVADLDLAGYILFSGATDKVTIPVSGLTDRENPSVTLNPADLLITKFADRSSAPNTYPVEVAAYDSSGNHSARSAAVSGHPATDVSAFGGADDTTVDPVKPSPPTGLAVAPAGEYELRITWQKPADGTATAGFRLYRSLTPFAGGAHVDDALQIASETTLEADDTSFTDTGLEGCRTYYYAVASINCDETLVPTYVYNASGATDYAAASGVPADNTPPPAPSLAGSIAGWRRAFITLNNPTAAESPDLLETKVFFSKTAAPQLVSGVVVGGTLIPDSDHGVTGSFTGRGSQVVVFDSESAVTPPAPTLENEGSYHILAVAYDRCLNTSTASTALVLIDLCGDDPPGQPPSSPANGVATSCESGSVDLAWEYEPKNADPPLYDFAGYRVERTGPTSSTVELTSGPTWLETWTDGGPLAAGGTYTYSVRATDCVFENQNALFPTNRSLPLTIGPVHPGGLGRYVDAADPLAAANFATTLSDASAPWTHHNNVRFNLRNTSAAPVTLRKLAATWDNPNAVLQEIAIGGSPSGTSERVIAAGGVSSGTPVAVGVGIADTAGGVGLASGPIPVRLRFTTPSGEVSRLVDMRTEVMEISLWTQSDSVQAIDCPTPETFTLEVPLGPILGGFSQTKPGIYGIDAYEVVGRSGTARDDDIKVPGGVLVNVYGTAFDTSRDVYPDGVNRGFAELKLVTVDAGVADAAAIPALPTSGTPVELPLQNIGGNRYAVYDPATGTGEQMPVLSDRVAWYYVLAVDRLGNWDRVPSPDFGAYAYYQHPEAAFNVCDYTPAAPVLAGTATAGAMSLSWSAPTAYDTGAPIPPTDTLRYELYYNHDGGTSWTLGSEQSGTSLTFAGDMAGQAWYFMVRAKNSCASPNFSAASNIIRECQGANAVYCTQFTFPSSALFGEAIGLAVSNACYYKNLISTDTVRFRVSSGAVTKDFSATESGSVTGDFTTTIYAREGSATGANEILAADGDTLAVALYNGAGTLLHCSGPDPAHGLTISGGACSTTPNPPTSFTAVRNNNTSARLAWVRPNYNTDGSPIGDLAGYVIEYQRCNTTSTSCNSWPASWSTYTLNSPTAQSHTLTGLTDNYRYRVRIRAKDTCSPTPNTSATAGPATTSRL